MNPFCGFHKNAVTFSIAIFINILSDFFTKFLFLIFLMKIAIKNVVESFFTQNRKF